QPRPGPGPAPPGRAHPGPPRRAGPAGRVVQPVRNASSAAPGISDSTDIQLHRQTQPPRRPPVSQPPSATSWLTDLLTGLAAASGVGYVAAAYGGSRGLTRVTPGAPRRTPSDLGLAWEPLTCRTADGLRLVGWAVTPPRPRGTVALFHGLRAGRAQTLGRTALLAAAGYRCVAFDHRAHGQSGGRRSSFGYYEGRDAAAVLALLRQRWPHQP